MDYNFNKLQMYFGLDYEVAEGITIHQPSIMDIVKYDDNKFYTMLNVFIGNPTNYRLALWDAGRDWNKITDYELFYNLIKDLDVKDTALLFGDLDFRLFKPFVQEKNGEVILINEKQNVAITEKIYFEIANYLRTMFNIFPKVEKVKGKTAKEWIIDEERMNLAQRQKENKNSSFLLPMISFALNHPGFKYNKEQLKDVGICEFMDSVQRLQIYESTSSLMKGMYSGFVDTSKIDKKEFNFMRDIA